MWDLGGAFGPAAEEAEHEVRSPLRLLGEHLGAGRSGVLFIADSPDRLV